MSDLQQLADKLMALRSFVENLNKTASIAIRNGGTYKGINLNQVFTCKHDNWTIGYKLEQMAFTFKRKVFLKVEGYRLDEIPEEQKDPVLTLCYDVFFDQGESVPEIEPVAHDAILIWQSFMPGYWYERSPGVVVPGKGQMN